MNSTEYGVKNNGVCLVWQSLATLVFLLPKMAAANLCISWSILRSPVCDNLCSDINTEFPVKQHCHTKRALHLFAWLLTLLSS